MHIVTMASRRGAGVWSHLPSLTVALLSRRKDPSTALWVDLGRRYEMLNHLGLAASLVQERASLAGIVDCCGEETATDPSALLELTAATLGAHASEGMAGDSSDRGYYGDAPPIRLLGPGIEQYRSAVSSFSSQGHRVFMVPLEVPSPPAKMPVVTNRSAEFASAVRRIVRATDPQYVFLTCEGQPEAHLFGEQLANNTLLQWALDVSAIILCFVRHDSVPRFHDSVAIPALLSRNPRWRNRLRLALTRATEEPSVPPAMQDMVLGHLPFSQFVGQAVSLGRIPVFDIPRGRPSPPEQNRYMRSIEALAQRLDESLEAVVTPGNCLQEQARS
ncbi:hypothetical protein [Lentzea sp. HUAS12]|uniref:hypothetical protein n=1 Tax=Lentzea sp. HUAS12 TaxID=2951806 RepID=UPI00209CCBCE|nr:hypothetical protein [Lentzea sp. HUAS12]USX56219.1 hypothetical protein ND450_19595 [Lentzea sp. HUAS12]